MLLGLVTQVSLTETEGGLKGAALAFKTFPTLRMLLAVLGGVSFLGVACAAPRLLMMTKRKKQKQAEEGRTGGRDIERGRRRGAWIE